MGFFSWNTADTKEQIRNIHSSNPSPTVYMLVPNGIPYEESAYEGYGSFGGKDSYELVCDINMPEYIHKNVEFRRAMGCALDMGDFCYDQATDKYYSFHYHELFDWVLPFEGNFGTIQPEYGKTPNDLVDEGIWIKVPIRDKILGDKEYLPLKFSFNKDAVYKDLPGSKDDQYQGFFDD